MSMMKTLAKVAIGVAVAKGVSGMMKQGSGGGTQTASRGKTGSGGLFGDVYSPGAKTQKPSGGGLEDLLGSVLAGAKGARTGSSGQTGGAMGGLGGLLEQLTSGGASTGGGAAGGINDLLRGLTGQGKAAPTGHLGGAQGAPGKSFGDLLNQALARQDEPEIAPTQDQEAIAALMLRAIIQAMKSDGEIDATEEKKLLSRLGDVSSEEMAFVQGEMRKDVDAKALAREVPRGLEQQIYTMSVMGIDLDNKTEAQYLHEFAQALGMEPRQVNSIHAELGVPQIYT